MLSLQSRSKVASPSFLLCSLENGVTIAFDKRVPAAKDNKNDVQAISINEFHAPRWASPYQARTGETLLLGRAILGSTDLDSYGLFILIGIAALVCYVLFYNVVICIAMKKLSCEALLLALLLKRFLDRSSEEGACVPNNAFRGTVCLLLLDALRLACPAYSHK